MRFKSNNWQLFKKLTVLLPREEFFLSFIHLFNAKHPFMIILIARILQYYNIFVENHWSVKTTTIFHIQGGKVKSNIIFSSSHLNCWRSISRSFFLSRFNFSRSFCLSVSYCSKIILRFSRVAGGEDGRTRGVVCTVWLGHGGMAMILAWTAVSTLHLFLRKLVILFALLYILAGLFCPILSYGENWAAE